MTIVYDVHKFVEEARTGSYSKKVLVEGDSWASNPFPNSTSLAMQVHEFDSFGYLLLNLAMPGDEAGAIFKSNGNQMKALKRLMSMPQWGDTFDLILLSASGNDVFGSEIVSKGYVKNKRDFPYLHGRELLTDSFYGVVSGVADGYQRFLRMRDTSGLNSATPVVTHVYSYFEPREVGTHLGPVVFNKKGWVKRHLKNQGITDRDEQYEIICEMLDALYRRLVRLESEFENFLVADTRQVLLKSGNPDTSLWADEIHPNKKGFKKLANQIRKAAQSRGLWKL